MGGRPAHERSTMAGGHRLMDARLATVLAHGERPIPVRCRPWCRHTGRAGATHPPPLVRCCIPSGGAPDTALRLVRNASRTRSTHGDAQHHADPASDGREESTMSGNVQHMVGVLERHDLQALRRWARGRLGFSSALLILAARSLSPSRNLAVAMTSHDGGRPPSVPRGTNHHDRQFHRRHELASDRSRIIAGGRRRPGETGAAPRPAAGGHGPDCVEVQAHAVPRHVSMDTVPVVTGSMPATPSMSNSGVLLDGA